MSRNFVDYNNATDLMNGVEDRIEKNYFEGTKEEWNALTDEQKAVYDKRVVHLKNGDNNPIDLSDYQKKNLDTPVTVGGVQQTQVEGAISALNGLMPSNVTPNNPLVSNADITKYESVSITGATSVETAIGLAWDAIANVDRVITGRFWYSGWYIFMGYKYTSTDYGMMIVQKVNDNSIYTLQVNNGTKIVKNIQPATGSVTSGSSAPLTSGAAYTALDSKMNITNGSFNAYTSGTLTLTRPAFFYLTASTTTERGILYVSVNGTALHITTGGGENNVFILPKGAVISQVHQANCVYAYL